MDKMVIQITHEYDYAGRTATRDFITSDYSKMEYLFDAVLRYLWRHGRGVDRVVTFGIKNGDEPETATTLRELVCYGSGAPIC